MIISQSPVRITLGGGGTDLPSYYSKYGGALIAAAIDKYTFVTAHTRFDDDIKLNYSQTEIVDNIDNIKHNIFREALRLLKLKKGIELTSLSDMPSSSGLGTSGSFTITLLNALHTYKKDFVSQKQLAEEACYIEMDILKEPIGKQDQYISAFGGIKSLIFDKKGNVTIESIKMTEEAIDELHNNILLFYTGIRRSASEILREQDNKSKKPLIKNVEKFRKTVKESITAAMNSSAREILHKYGTSGMLEALVELGDTPIKNFIMGEWDREKVQKISGQTMAKTVLRKQYHCEACPVGCGRIVELPNKEKKIVDGPEYETVAAFGTLVLNDDLVTILKANYMCNAYGLDTISTGVTIAFTIECVERGILSETDGLEISWGNDKAILQLIEKITKREGIGNSLAEGVKNIAQQLNKESNEFAMHVKGLELPMHDPRAFESWALAYATSNRGACHTYASTYYIEKGLTFPEIGLPEPLDRFEIKSKPRAVKLIQDMCEFLDAQVMCRFCLYGGTKLPTVIKALNAVTGEEITIEEVMKIGERIFNTKRVINNLQGIRREHDNLPPRIFKPLDPPGGTYGHVPELNHNLQEYYRLRGWNEDGTVSNEKLRELEIE